MTATKVNNGTYANDPTADPLYDAFNTINDNYDLLGTASERNIVTSTTDQTPGRVITTGYDATKLSGLGTAASLNAVTSSTDVTANRLLKTGASFEQLGIDNMGLEYRPLPKPTLDLDFANQRFEIYSKANGFELKSLADIVSQGRSTAGSSVDAIGGITEFAAGENRFTFDGETGEALGYLSEESRANLLTNSEFPNGLSDAPSRGGLVTLSSMDLGNGDINALAFGYDGVTTTYAYKNFTTSLGVTYTLSVFIQMTDGLPPVFLSSTPSSISNDLSLRVSTFSPSPLSYTVAKVYGNTYKVSATYTATTTGTDYGVVKNLGNSPRTFKVTGYDLQVGSFPTSYIKTLGTAVVRSADAMTRTLGQEWNPNEGTFVVEFDDFPKISEHAVFTSSRFALNDNFISAFYQKLTNRFLVIVRSSGVTQTFPFPYESRKFSVSIKDGYIIISNDGGNLVTGSVVNMPLNQQVITIASRIDGTAPMTTNVKRFQYYPRAFDALTLQRLSRIQ